jgi:hypothetical protein
VNAEQGPTAAAQKGPSVTLSAVDIDRLYFDTLNPRLPEGVDGAKDEEVVRWMLLDGTLLDLMGSIAEHGYFEGEPVLIVPRDEANYTVVEGNRRLAAMRLLLNPDKAPVRKTRVLELSEMAAPNLSQSISAVIFPKRDDIVDYLGFRHITGVKEWGPLSKARYLRQLWDRTPGTASERLQALARKIGSQPYYVKRLLGGLRLFDTIEENDFFNISELNEGSLSFSLLSTALSFESLTAYLGVPEDPADQKTLDTENVERFTRWVFEKQQDGGRTILGESRNMTALAAIVASPDARNLLEQGATLADAVLATEHMGGQFTRALRLSRDRLDTAQKMIRRVNQPTEADADLLSDIMEAADDLLSLVRRRMRKNNRAE